MAATTPEAQVRIALCLEDIESDGIFGIGGIKIRHVFSAVPGNVIEKINRQVPMGVDHTNSLPGFDVLENEIPQECRLPGSRFPENVAVMSPVVRRNTKEEVFILPYSAGPHDDVLGVLHISKQASTPNGETPPEFSASIAKEASKTIGDIRLYRAAKVIRGSAENRKFFRNQTGGIISEISRKGGGENFLAALV